MNKALLFNNLFHKDLIQYSPKDIKQNPTNVIFISISNLGNTNITHDYIYYICSKFGNVLRILIFEKNGHCKALVEFSLIPSAIEAKKMLDNTTLSNNISKINVMFTHIESLKSYNSEGDFSILGSTTTNLPQFKDYTLEETLECLNEHGLRTKMMINKKSISSTMTTLETSSSLESSKYSSSMNHIDFDKDDHDVLKIINTQENLSENCSIEDEEQHEQDRKEILDELDEQLLLNNFQDRLFFHKEKTFDEDNNKGQRNLKSTLENNQHSYHQHRQQNMVRHHPLQEIVTNLPQKSLSTTIAAVLTNDENTNKDNNTKQQQQHLNDNDPHINEEMHHLKEEKHQNQKELLDMIDRQIYANLVGTVQQNLSKLSNVRIDNMNYHKNELLPKKYFSMTDIMLEKEAVSPPKLINDMIYMKINKQGNHWMNSHHNETYNNNNNNTTTTTTNANNTTQYFSQHKIPSCSNLDTLNQLPLFSSSIKRQYSYNQNSELIPHNTNINTTHNNNINHNIDQQYLEKNIKNTLLNLQLIESLNENRNSNQKLVNNALYNNTQYSPNNSLDFLKAMIKPQSFQNLPDCIGIETKKSQVLYIRGLEHKDIKTCMIYNIFSNFGNILKIILIRNKAAALIEFENSDYSTISKDFLNNIVFMGKPLRIYYSNYSMINLKKNLKENCSEDIFIGSPKNFRFKKNKNLSINPPSSTLHISNLVKEMCNEALIKKIFSEYGRVEAIKFIFMEKSKNMCLLKMASLEESLNAMAYLHDTDLSGRKMQVSFTRSKI